MAFYRSVKYTTSEFKLVHQSILNRKMGIN